MASLPVKWRTVIGRNAISAAHYFPVVHHVKTDACIKKNPAKLIENLKIIISFVINKISGNGFK
jgi:hypothetical protein